MEYFRPNHSIESDRMSLSSLREGSLTSDLDDLTVIAEFDNFSEYDDDVSTYRLSPTYEMVGCSLRRKSSLKKPPKTSQDTNIQTDDSVWKNHYSHYNNNKTPTNAKNNNFFNKDFPNNINTNNNNSSNIFDGNISSNNSTLRKILKNNEEYDTDDFDGVVENNLRINGDKHPSKKSTSSTWHEVGRKQPKPITYDKNRKDYKIKTNNLISTGTNPINFDSLNDMSTQNGIQFKPNSYFPESSKKYSNSFYVPLEDDTGFYENGQPIDRMDLKKTRGFMQDKATMTNPNDASRGWDTAKKEIKTKELRDKASMTSEMKTTTTSTASTSTIIRHHNNQETCTDADITKVDFIDTTSSVDIKDGGVDDDVYRQMDELMKETEELYAQLETEIDNKKRKEMQYEDLMKDHEGAMEDMKSLKQDLDLLKQKAENEKKSLKVQTNRTSQTETTTSADAATQETSTEDMQMTKDFNLLQDEVQRLENELEHKQGELDSLSSKLHQTHSEMEQLSGELENINYQKSNNAEEELKKLKSAVSTSELNALANNQKLQKVLEDTMRDLKTVEQKLKQANQQLKNKSQVLEESEEKMKDFESREGSLDRIIGNLKTEITHLNDKISEASKRSEEMDSQHLSQPENEEALMNEITRLMKVNADLNEALRDNNLNNTANEDLIRKYNDLRNVSSRLQTAVSPLKAKLSLANKKIKEKNALLEGLVKRSGRVPEEYRRKVEESIKEQPRPLSPLTLDPVDRLEHDLINHLHDSFPNMQGVPVNDHSSRRTKSTNNLLDTLETASRMSYNDLSNNPDQSFTNTKLISLFEKPDSTLFESKREYSKFDKASKLRSPRNFDRHRSPVLIDTVSSYNNKPSDSHLLLTNSLKADVLGSKRPTFEYNSINSFRKPPSRSYMTDASMPPRSTLTSYNDIPPPRDFQIDRMEGRKRLLFCWEPPMDRATNSPVVGYELYVSGKMHASISGKKENNYQLHLPASLHLPSTFSLHSLTADGQLSAPSQIILHGLHKNKGEAVRDGSESGKTNDRLKLKSSQVPLSGRKQSSNMQKRMFVAFFDFKGSGHQMEMDGVRYNELSFLTGDLIETFGDAMTNGYVIGKIKGTTVKGLVPATFLETAT